MESPQKSQNELPTIVVQVQEPLSDENEHEQEQEHEHVVELEQEQEELDLDHQYGSDESLAQAQGTIIKPSVGFKLGRGSSDDVEVRNMEMDMEPVDEELFRTDHTFEKLLEIYQYTIAGLEGSEREGISLEPIKKLFAAVWEGVEHSHANVMRLQHNDHEISVDLSTVMAKTRTLIKLAEDDPEVATRLKTKLEVAWNLADIGEIDEVKNSVRIFELKDEIAILNRNIMNASKAQGQETIVELQAMKAELEGEKQIFVTEVNNLQSTLDIVYLKRQNLAETKIGLEEKMKMLLEEERVQKAAVAREYKRKEAIDANVRIAIDTIHAKRLELKEVGETLLNSKGLLISTERSVMDQRIVNEEAQRGMELSGSKVEKMKSEYEAQTKACHKLTLELFKKQADLKEREDDVLGMRQEVVLATRQLTSNQKKVDLHKTTISGLEQERDALKQKLAVLEKDLEAAQRRLEENKRKIEELDKNRAGINRTLQGASVITNEHISQALTHEMAVKNLEVEISGYEKEISAQNKCIARLERERDNYSHEALKLAHQVAVRLEEVKKLDLNIFEYRKRLGEIESQLKKVQQIYETAVYDRQLLQRSLTETQKEIYDNSVRISHLSHHIISLIFQIGESDNVIHREVMKYDRLIKDTVFFTGEAKRIKGMAHDIQRMVEALDVERGTLGRTVAEAEGEISKQNYYANSAESRKAMYSRKLMAKEQELRDIWDKWRVLHSTIRIGAYHFRNMMAEIRQIRYSIFKAKKERLVFTSSTRNMHKLNHEIVVLENIISQETCMCNTLRESMKHPINVHRWRVLQATDPDAYDMVLKVNLLTKRIVERNSTLSEQSNDLTFKQEIYCQIRDALKKAPGLEAPENVRYYRHLQKAKVKQLDALKYELKAAESQTEYYEEEIRRHQDRLKQIKAKYFQRQKSQKKTICHEYKALPIEFHGSVAGTEYQNFQSIAAGMEWKKDEASSLTLYEGEAGTSPLTGNIDEGLALISLEKPTKARSLNAFKKMKIGKDKSRGRKSSEPSQTKSRTGVISPTY